MLGDDIGAFLFSGHVPGKENFTGKDMAMYYIHRKRFQACISEMMCFYITAEENKGGYDRQSLLTSVVYPANIYRVFHRMYKFIFSLELRIRVNRNNLDCMLFCQGLSLSLNKEPGHWIGTGRVPSGYKQNFQRAVQVPGC